MNLASEYETTIGPCATKILDIFSPSEFALLSRETNTPFVLGMV